MLEMLLPCMSNPVSTSFAVNIDYEGCIIRMIENQDRNGLVQVSSASKYS